MAASVSSLDQDMRRLRFDRYTPEAAAELRTWIESTLGERLASDDLLESLKDGVTLCKLVNMVLPPPGIKYKASSMPFTQRENISQFLKACELPPLNLPAHDRFLTVDLYDEKDPAQVVQCIGAFSRAAHSISPSKFPTVIGPKRVASPTRKPNPLYSTPDSRNTARAMSPSLTGGSDSSKATDGLSRGASTVSSWSKRSDEVSTAPAWNIHQYGYMGGASQGNQGISFGARRQITSPGVGVPSLAEKEQRRKEQEEEARREAEEVERKRRAEREAEERQARLAEEQRWEEETRKARAREQEEFDQLERQRREWAEEEKRWEEEQRRRKEEEDVPVLRGQFLSERNAERTAGQRSVSDSNRIKELERQLEEAKQREQQYQLEREQKERSGNSSGIAEADKTKQRPQSVSQSSADDSIVSASDEREFLQKQWEAQPKSPAPRSPPGRSPFQRPLPVPKPTPSNPAPLVSRPSKPLEAPQAELQPAPPPSATAEPPKQVTERAEVPPTDVAANRTERYLASAPAPVSTPPRTNYPSEMGMSSTSERAAEDARRVAGQAKTKAGGWASKSLLEKEMELERQRQRDWEEQQMAKMQASAQQRGLMGPRELKR